MTRLGARLGRRFTGAGPLLVGTLLIAPSADAAPGDVAHGKEVFAVACAPCHGANGEGDGPAAEFMLPRPRVFFDSSTFKFRTTSSDSLPTDQDIFNVITRGVPGTPMSGFENIPEQERWDLVAFIKSLTEDFQDLDEIAEIVPFPELVNPPPRPGVTPESIAEGRKVYERAQCAKCHGDLGRGNGESFAQLKDSWDDTPIVPSNLTNPESFRGGSESFDLFRTFATGLRGTPMPEYRDAMTPEQRWQLVNYVESLYRPEPIGPGSTIEANEVAHLPQTGNDDGWSSAPVARIRTFSNVIEPPRLYWASVEFVEVQALYTAKELALRIQWDDRSQSSGANIDHEYEDGDGTVYRGTDHPDQLAIQFPVRTDPNKRPYLLFGDKKRAVNLWWWRGDDGTLSERTAKGYGAISDQADDSQALEGQVTFADGRYTAVIRRSLTTADTKRDVQFTPGEFVPVLFNVWDGDRGEVGQRRALTTWYWVDLKTSLSAQAYIAPPITFVVSLGLLLGLVYTTRKRARAKTATRDDGARIDPAVDADLDAGVGVEAAEGAE